MALATLAACGTGAATADAGPADGAAGPVDAAAEPLWYELHLYGHWDDLDSSNDAGISVTINGEPAPTASKSEFFSTYEEAADARYSIETWLGDALLYHSVQSPGLCKLSCTPYDEPLTIEKVTLCLEASGELRLNYLSCSYCHGDWDCPMACDPMDSDLAPTPSVLEPTPQPSSSLRGQNKCGLIVTVREPLYAYFDEVPEGRVAIGEACRRGPPGPETGYDDCVSGGVCWQGKCRALCTQNPCADGSRCRQLPRRRDRIGWCDDDGGKPNPQPQSVAD